MPLPALPAPHTWTSGQVVQADVLRADVSDAVALLSSPPMFIGQQTVTSQSVTSSTDNIVFIDTEIQDNWNGHRIDQNQGTYYGMFAGWYLCECTVPLNYTGGTGILSVGVGGVQNGGANAVFYGATVPNNSGLNTESAGARLMQMVNVGVQSGASNDYIRGYMMHSAPGTQTLLNGTQRIPTLTCMWVCANSGTQPLAVPANPAWPVPPTVTTAAFMNANVRNAINFLIYPPIMEWSYNTTGQTLASQTTIPLTGTTINLVSNTVDNYSAFSNSTNKWTAPVAGVYYVYGQVSLSMNTTGLAYGAGLTVTSANYNGGTTITLWGGTAATGGGGVLAGANIARRMLRLNAGDTVALAGFYRDSSATAATVLGSGSASSKLITVWRSA